MKRWTQSRTLWLNIASIVTTLATLALANLTLLGLPDYALFWWMLGLTLVVNVCNIYLRLDTKEAIGNAPDEFKGENG
jgi:hypothetical protein